MSEDQIELHKIIGSPSSLGKLSSTEALFHSTQNDGHTEVGQMAPLYQTVPEAQRVHSRYATEPVNAVTHREGVYTVPSESDPPNEYDIINERQSRGGQTKHVAEPAGDVTRCKMKDMFYCFIHLIAIVLSVIALVLVVVITVGSNCSCNTSELNYQHFFFLSVGKSLGTSCCMQFRE